MNHAGLMMNNRTFTPDQTNKLSESGWLFVGIAFPLAKKGNWEVIPSNLFLQVRHDGATLFVFASNGACFLNKSNSHLSDDICKNPYWREDMTGEGRFPILLQEKHVQVILEAVFQLNPSLRRSSLELLLATP
jgi:hypothetical protein